ncbi:MAG: agmatinase family protein [Rikenellaceae bacterium]
MNIDNFDPNGVGVDNGAYFSMPFSIEQARLVLVSAPWDVTVSYASGAAIAPDAIIEASMQLDFYDSSAPDAWHEGIATAEIDYSLLEESQRLRRDAQRVIDHLEEGGDLNNEYIARYLKRVNQGSERLNENIYKQCSDLLSQGKLVGLVGGDHSTPYGAIKALSEHHNSFGVLHIDAHCDLREAYEGFEFSHASIMFNVLRDFEQVEHLVQVGVRDYCDDELALVKGSDRITSFDDYLLARARFEGETWRAQCEKIVEQLPSKVYISFDIDGLSISYCPNTGTPVSGGMSFNEALYLLERVTESGRTIIGFDLVEVAPNPKQRIDAIVGARMLYKLCGQTIKSNKKSKK